jgi:nucleoside-diphosphate-sugar epimerase
LNLSSTIFITGATGFIGSYITRLLFKKGYRNIIGLRRKNSSLDLLGEMAKKVQWIEGDLFQYEKLDSIIRETDIVIHAAALVSFHKGDQKELMKTNVQGTANMINLALEHDVKHFHYISSIASLGRSLDKPMVTEESHFQNTALDTTYGLSKHLAEMEVWRGQAEGLAVSVINPSLVLGAAYWHKGSPEYFSTVADGIRFYPAGATGFVDVRDVARMSVQLIEENHLGERFICNGTNTTHKEVMSIIARRFDKREPAYEVTRILAAIAWRAEFIRAFVMRRRPIITQETLRVSRQRFAYDNSKSKERLDFTYTALEDTINQMSDLYQKAQKEGRDFTIMEW